MVEWFSELITDWSSREWAIAGGLVTALVCATLTKSALVTCEVPPKRWPLLMTLIGLLLGAALAYSMKSLQCQQTPVVLPDAFWGDMRIVSHTFCLGLLLVITATDLASLYIPNFVVNLGLVVAILSAVCSGQLQMEHLWVDWNEEVPQIQGPWIPAWIKTHQHWHGLGWSVAGALVAAGLTAVVRKIAAVALGRPAMGAGDVTLMAMIGAFLGWQASVIAFFLAPALALALGPLARRVSKESAVPYGPFLAMAAVIVMFGWKSIWMFEVDISLSGSPAVGDRATAFAVRRLFGDGLLLAALAVTALGGTAILMSLMRLYWNLPIEREATSPETPTSDLPATVSQPLVGGSDDSDTAGGG